MKVWMIHQLKLCFDFSTFSGKDDGTLDTETELDQIYLEYSKLLSKISQVRHQSLDIKNESLGAYFVQVK